MPIRAKQTLKSRTSGAFNAAGGAIANSAGFLAAAAVIGSLLYGGSTGIYNMAGGLSNQNAVDGTEKRTKDAYIARQVGPDNARVTVSIRDIEYTDGDKIKFKAGTISQIKDTFERYQDAAKKWNSQIHDILYAVADNDVGFTFTFSGSGDGTRLLELADRYNLTLLPAQTPTEWPSLTVGRGEGGTYAAVMTVSKTWEASANAQALRAFLHMLADQEQVREDMTGTFKLRRDASGALTVYEPGKLPALPGNSPNP
jgi:hypothetical protein